MKSETSKIIASVGFFLINFLLLIGGMYLIEKSCEDGSGLICTLIVPHWLTFFTPFLGFGIGMILSIFIYKIPVEFNEAKT